MADKRAAFYPRYGINAVRLHKFADGTGWSGIQSKESAAEYDPAGLDRMDYQVAKFKEAGIYVKLSAHFGTIKLGPADRRDVPFLDEFGSFDGKRNDRVNAPHSAFFYSPELQNLHIRQIVNLLQHRNPHTGLTYAEDPAICAVEIINEQSVMFFTSMAPLKQSATLRRQVGERFSALAEEEIRQPRRPGESVGRRRRWTASRRTASPPANISTSRTSCRWATRGIGTRSNSPARRLTASSACSTRCSSSTNCNARPTTATWRRCARPATTARFSARTGRRAAPTAISPTCTATRAWA